MFFHQGMVALHEVRQFGVANPQTVAARLVHVGRSDTLEGGADLGLAFRSFGGCVEQAVGRQDQVRLARDEQPGRDVEVVFGQIVDLFGQDHRVDHHAVAHHIDRLFVENARGDGMQYVFYPAEFQRVSGVGAALETGDDVVAGREHVHDFSFAFVSPLETQKKIDCHDMRYVFSVVSYKP